MFPEDKCPLRVHDVVNPRWVWLGAKQSGRRTFFSTVLHFPGWIKQLSPIMHVRMRSYQSRKFFLSHSSSRKLRTKQSCKDLETSGDQNESFEDIRPSEDPELLPQHRIFLSHSGAQKPFVERLCEDLENAGYFPFFDQRPESLPKGAKFADLIFEAARKCRLALIVLSDDYCMSKWPMLELVTFVEAQQSVNPTLRILPLFYKLDLADLNDPGWREKVMQKWSEFAAKDTRIDLQRWTHALKVLTDTNGEELNKHGGSELRYCKQVVASVCQCIQPDLQYDVSAMEGRDRICSMIVDWFSKPWTFRHRRAAVLGLYGMGGMGKTLICKALCNIFHEEFSGRVCHVECTGRDSPLHLLKEILEKLTGANPYLLRGVTTIEASGTLLKRRLPMRDVFLAIDNLPPDSDIPWLTTLLENLSPKSKAVLTSRSANCARTTMFTNWWPVPTVTNDEAMNIFLQKALPEMNPEHLTPEEKKVVQKCIQQCFFFDSTPKFMQVSTVISPGIGGLEYSWKPDKQGKYLWKPNKEGHYHPLALRVLGIHLNGINSTDPLGWPCYEKLLPHLKHSLFDILRTGYDSLRCLKDKLFFLDIAVFAPREKLNSLQELSIWLGNIHDMSQEEVLYKLRNLQRLSLVEDWEMNRFTRIAVHELHRDFAMYEIKRESIPWCVYEGEARTLPRSLERSPSNQFWPDLVRVMLLTPKPIAFAGVKIREWVNLEVLCIDSFDAEELDIGPLKHLRSLCLVSHTLRILAGSSSLEKLHSVKLTCERLQSGLSFMNCSDLHELITKFGDALSNVRSNFLTFKVSHMRILELVGWNTNFPKMVNIENLIHLMELKIVGGSAFHVKLGDGKGDYCRSHLWKLDIQGLHALTNLRLLILNRLPIGPSVIGLENLTKLKHMAFNGCSRLTTLPTLNEFSDLRVLDLSGTGIQELQGVDKMLELRGLFCVECRYLSHLPDLDTLPKLKEVFTQGCLKLTKQPLVPDGCTLVAVYKEEVLDEVRNFLKNFGRWTNKEIKYDELLEACPIPYLRDDIPVDLYEIRKALFVEISRLHSSKGKRHGFNIGSVLFPLIGDPSARHPDIRAFRKALTVASAAPLIHVRKPYFIGSRSFYTPDSDWTDPKTPHSLPINIPQPPAQFDFGGRPHHPFIKPDNRLKFGTFNPGADDGLASSDRPPRILRSLV